MEVVKVSGPCVTLKDGRKWNMSRIAKCTTTNVPNPVEYRGDNDIDGDNFHHMDISYSNNQQAVPVETDPYPSVDNGQIPNVVATRNKYDKTCISMPSQQRWPSPSAGRTHREARLLDSANELCCKSKANRRTADRPRQPVPETGGDLNCGRGWS